MLEMQKKHGIGEHMECTIYSEDVLDLAWGKWNVPVTKEGLISCIEEFVRMKEERK